MVSRSNFLLPHSSYRGVMRPDNLVFNANLQEFSQRVNFISCLGSNGKLTPTEAFEQIQALWQELEQIEQGLDIHTRPSEAI